MATPRNVLDVLAVRTQAVDHLIDALDPAGNGLLQFTLEEVAAGLKRLETDFANFQEGWAAAGRETMSPLSAEEFYYIFTKSGSIVEVDATRCDVRRHLALKMRLTTEETAAR